jgi:cell division transport system permease protein
VRAQFVLSEIGIGLRRNLTMTVAVVLTVAISMGLFGAGLLISRQVTDMKGYWYDKIEASVYLCGSSSAKASKCHSTPVSDAERAQLQTDLQSMPQVSKVYYESKQQAYDRFKELYADSPDLINNVSVDVLPESFRVKLKNPKEFDVLSSAIADRPGVDIVEDNKRTLAKLFNLLDAFQNMAWFVAAASLVAAVLLVANTVRVAAFSRRRETGIMRLVGASNMYIQLPFLLEGALAGLVGSALACGGLAAVKVFIIDGQLRPNLPPFTRLLGWPEVLSVMPLLIVVGVVLSALTSFVSLRRFLRV